MTIVNRSAPSIVRHVVLVDVGNGPHISECFCTRDEAIVGARKHKMMNVVYCAKKVSVSRWELRPNKKILEFGADRFDRMLTDLSSYGFTVTGSLDDLIDCGVIGSYIRDVLGKSGCRSACDEYGNTYRLYKRGKNRFELTLHLRSEPEQPYGMKIVDPLDTDISSILEKFITA